jgi:NhaA family Na+:H+ antiporter
MPIFALANAGVSLSVESLDASAWKVITGTGAGLFLGKPIGIFLTCWLLLKLKISTLPLGLGLRHLVILGTVAGVGFTMALFVAQLAFSDPTLLGAAKLGILGASLVSGIVGLILGRLLPVAPRVPGQARTVDEAERSTEA